MADTGTQKRPENTEGPSRQVVLSPKFLAPAEAKILAKNLVHLNNFLTREKSSVDVLRLELEETVQNLIHPALMTHDSSKIRLLVTLALTRIMQLIGVKEVLGFATSDTIETFFNLLLQGFELLTKANFSSKDENESAAAHSKSLHHRAADCHIFSQLGKLPKLMPNLFKTFLEAIPYLSVEETELRHHMVIILTDCLEAALPNNQELVELLAAKLVFEEPDEKEEFEANGDEDDEEEDDEEKSDDEELMMDTQEAPKLKEKKRAKMVVKEAVEMARREAEFAGEVLKSAHRAVEPAIGTLLHGPLEAETRIFSERLELLVSRLAEIRPSLVNLLLPELQERVTNEMAQTRLSVVECLASLFIAPGFQMACLEYNHLFNAFVGRFKDNDVEIRATMVRFGQLYLLSSAPSAGVQLVRDALKDRISSEREPAIRAEAIKAIGTVACDPHGINRLDIETLRLLVDRALDKSELVRQAVAEQLMAIYDVSVEQLLFAMEADEETKAGPKTTTRQEVQSRLGAWKERFSEFVAEIPSVLLQRVFTREFTFDERHLLDTFINQSFIHGSCLQMARYKAQLEQIKAGDENAQSPSKSKSKPGAPSGGPKKSGAAGAASSTKSVTYDPSDLARHVILQVASLTDIARKAFYKWMDEKKAFREDLKLAISGGAGESQAAFQAALEKKLGVKKSVPLTDLLRSDLEHLIDPASAERRIKATCESFLKHIKKKHEETGRMITGKACFAFFSKDVAKEWILLLKSLSTSNRATKLAEPDHSIYTILCAGVPDGDTQLSVALDVTQRAAAVHPAYFAPSLEAINSLLSKSKHPEITKAMTRISRFTATLPAADADGRDDLIDALTKVAMGTDIKTAAEAGTALLAQFSASEEALAAGNEFIGKQIKAVKAPLSENTAAALASLTPLAKLIESRLALPLIHHSYTLIAKALAEKPKTQLTNKNSESPADYLSMTTRTAVEAIQFVVSWYRNLAVRNTTTASSSSSNDPLKTPTKSRNKTPINSPFSPARKAKKSAAAVLSPTKVIPLSRDQESTMQTFATQLGEIAQDDGNDLDHVFLRAAAVTGLIRLSEHRAYADLINVDLYLHLASVVMDDTTPELLRNEISATLLAGLSSVNRLPIKFLPFLALMPYAPPLTTFVEERRAWIKQKSSAFMGAKGDTDDFIARLKASTLPENAIPWLVYILAHTIDLEEDAPNYKQTCDYLKGFLSQLLTENNSNYILRILDDIRQVEDASKEDSTAVHVVAELGLRLMEQLLAADKRRQKAGAAPVRESAVVFLPTQLFKLRYEEKENGQQVVKVSSNLPSLLPTSFRSPATTPSKAKKSRSVTAKKSGKRKRAAPSFDDSDEEEEVRSETSDEEMMMDVDSDSDDKNNGHDNDSEVPTSDDEEEEESARPSAKKRRAVTVAKASTTSSAPTSPKSKTPAKKSNNAVAATKKTTAAASANTAATRTPKRTGRAKKGGLDRDIFGSDSSDEEDTLPVAPARPKRALEAAKQTSPKPRRNAMEETAEEEVPEEAPPAPKRPKRAAATPSSTPKPKASSSRKHAVEEEEASEEASVEEQKPASRTRSAQSKSAASTPARGAKTASSAKVSASATKKKRT